MSKWVNSEGYTDITACKAISRVDRQRIKHRKRSILTKRLKDLKSFKDCIKGLKNLIKY